ncbi:MAG: Uma2 family endonuclease, partial [Sphaerospermopsis sp. SIO1G2]|nr:Uma2 family endonuclease [Sphaerospermopsis sp. SIO1G2]
VVFEILSPGNRTKEMSKKMVFYQRYGVEEYYIYNPDTFELTGLLREEEWFTAIEEMNNWVSPRLGIRFELTSDNLEIYYPDGRNFLTSIELNQQLEQEKQRANQEQQKYQDLLAKLQAKGIDIDSL